LRGLIVAIRPQRLHYKTPGIFIGYRSFTKA
jgi:hypothetical protein